MSKLDLSVNIAGIHWKNPITTAAGTFAARASGEFYNISKLGAVTTKAVTLNPWLGNQTPRIAETYGGMLNSVGLHNFGVEHYIDSELPYLEQFGVPVIANIAGHNPEEYREIVERLNDTSVAMYEINISCPNIAENGMNYGAFPEQAALITSVVKKAAKKPIIIKLSPNVTDIASIAKAVEDAGADGISMINTLLGMRIDVRSRKATLANKMGGLSGPAIKPVALRMVYQVRKVVNIPIIGMGGITTGEDAAEFIMAGADALAIGTAALVMPTAPMDILGELRAVMQREGFSTLYELRQAFKEQDERLTTGRRQW